MPFMYQTPIGVLRGELVVPPGGTVPGSDWQYTLKHLVEPLNMEYVLLTGDQLIHISNLADADYAIALASAYNDI